MVVHNDKWKKKASREYHKKHGTLPTGRGRGRGRGAPVTEEEPTEPLEEQLSNEDEDDSNEEDDSNKDSEKEETTTSQPRQQRSKYARRKIESNAWRFESEEPDPYLGKHSLSGANSVINEEALEPPEPDYAHLPARPFQTRRQLQNIGQQSTGAGRGKKHTISEKELAPLKSQIDKANAARAFKERFGSTPKGNVITVGEDGVARRQHKEKVDDESDEGLEDIDTFLAELDMKKGISFKI